MTSNNIFSTRELALGATLITLGFEMAGIDYQYEGERPRPVGYFKFQESPELKNAVKNYWGSALAVEPRSFVLNMRSLKAQVTDGYNNPHEPK